jgi:hypothetical protein
MTLRRRQVASLVGYSKTEVRTVRVDGGVETVAHKNG